MDYPIGGLKIRLNNLRICIVQKYTFPFNFNIKTLAFQGFELVAVAQVFRKDFLPQNVIQENTLKRILGDVLTAMNFGERTEQAMKGLYASKGQGQTKSIN